MSPSIDGPASAFQDRRLRNDLVVLLALAAARLFVHLLLDGQYGFHRDELGLRDDALALDWGYVSYPPLTAALAWLSIQLFGDSLTGFRAFAALAQSLAMLFTGLIARELGGGRRAQVLAALAMSAAPFALLAGSMMQYVGFDFLWWVLLAWLLVRLVNTGHQPLWLAIGAVIGAGMMTRYTILVGVAGLVAGVLATPLRRHLRSRWLWAGVALSLLLFAPNAWWQWRHDFVYLDFLAHIRARDAAIGRSDGFLLQQLFVNASPLLLPLWLAGLGWLAWARDEAAYRVLAWIYVVALGLFMLLGARAYYLAPAYPMLLAAGAVAAERGLLRLRPRPARWAAGAGWSVLALALAIGAVVALPVSPVGSIGWRVSRAAHDNFAEQIGWPELVAQVAAIHASLPPEERVRTGIYASNYGQAGAINLYGPASGLPRAISGVNTHWYRGFEGPEPTHLIVLGASAQDMSEAPAQCTAVARVSNAAGVENEETRHHPEIFLCRDLTVPLRELWPQLRSYG